jgi:hypothetical protein
MGALVVLCLLAILGLTQCKVVTDKLTAPDRGRETSANRCIKACNEQYADSLEAEEELHEKNLKKCKGRGGDDDRDRNTGGTVAMDGAGDGDRHRDRRPDRDPACVALEQARHEAAVARIEAGRSQCIASCHHQGGGTGR